MFMQRHIRNGIGYGAVLLPLAAALGAGSAPPLSGDRAGEAAVEPAAPAPSPPRLVHERDADLRPLRVTPVTEADAGEPDRARPFAPGRSHFTVRFRNRALPYRVMGVTALPGEAIRVAVPEGDGPYRLSSQAGDAVEDEAARSWTWRAPDAPGVYALQVTDTRTFRFVHMNVFVLHPRGSAVGGVLNGYRIGSYPANPLGGDPDYLPPAGFAEVRQDEQDILVSPHFTVGQFLCHQPGEPKYLALSQPLIVKLEAVLEAVNGAGFEAPTLHVMSGFRTPHYHRRVLGRRTTYSRHMWGDAADVFVDVDGNHVMDDLNGDGAVGISDARLFAGLVEEVEDSPGPGVKVGGLGIYRGSRVSGPFVHVDARGERVRW